MNPATVSRTVSTKPPPPPPVDKIPANKSVRCDGLDDISHKLTSTLLIAHTLMCNGVESQEIFIHCKVLLRVVQLYT